MAGMSRAEIFAALARLYERMQAEYALAARLLELSCDGCPRNCCTSHFQHHTYVEWAYLWEGLSALPPERREAYLERARQNVEQVRAAVDQGQTPQVLCPLCDDGRCGLYGHRLMICRLHGVPNRLMLPSGQSVAFAGCWKSQELSQGRESLPVMDRTPLYLKLLGLESAFRATLPGAEAGLPKVDLTLAQMLLAGPPQAG